MMPLMEALGALADYSLLALFFGLLALFLAATELGFRLGRRSYNARTADEPSRAGIGCVVGGMLGLLAFLLGIALSLADGKHETRRTVVLNEANAIGTAWLRAGVTGGEEGAAMQRLLATYTQVRIDAVVNIRTEADAERVNTETARLQNEIWSIATVVARANPTALSGQLLASLNETFDLALSSRRAFTDRVPIHILRLLLVTSIIAVAAMGYNFGANGSRQAVMATLLLVLWCSAMVLIVDVNRPRQGMVQVSPAPLEWTLQGFGPPR